MRSYLTLVVLSRGLPGELARMEPPELCLDAGLEQSSGGHVTVCVPGGTLL